MPQTLDVPAGHLSEAEVQAHKKTSKVLYPTYLLLAGAALVLYFLFGFHLPRWISPAIAQIIVKASISVFWAVVVLVLARLAEGVFVRHRQDAAAAYNLRRVIRLVAVALIVLIAVTTFFADWYAAVVSLGLISLVLGFALQTPIMSFLGWIYILVRAPYRVGDRVRIGNIHGDVVEVGYLETTLWEFGGELLNNAMPSGRVVTIPNSLALSSPVYNYSWKSFPFVWNEFPIHVAYDSDLPFVKQLIERVATQALGDQMAEHVKAYKQLLAETNIRDLSVSTHPVVTLSVNDNTWIELNIRYLVEPHHMASTRTKLVEAVLEELQKYPEKVRFPAANNR